MPSGGSQPCGAIQGSHSDSGRWVFMETVDSVNQNQRIHSADEQSLVPGHPTENFTLTCLEVVLRKPKHQLCFVSPGASFWVDPAWSAAGQSCLVHRPLGVQPSLLGTLGLDLMSYHTGFRAEKEDADPVSSAKAQPLLRARGWRENLPELQGEGPVGPQKQMLA